MKGMSKPGERACLAGVTNMRMSSGTKTPTRHSLYVVDPYYGGIIMYLLAKYKFMKYISGLQIMTALDCMGALLGTCKSLDV